ncbi:PPPDE putative peptidase domain-containing protein [Sporodiniella umbellata]|nr:PPPDE putative peptidase domain-containing protein [Sporodiniella umbellata]
MSEGIKLYVYDLSQGMAKTMSLALTGKQIDGIWHTSVVVFGKEIFFGQGIMITSPGTTQHGKPLQVVDIGETYLPEDVVMEYVDSLRPVYTAEKYHLLDFNCNTFSNDLCQFLCGQDIPAHITGLPSEVLNTPFGQSILPMIEGMFGQSQLRPSTATSAQPPVQPPESVQRLLQGEGPNAGTAELLQNLSAAAMSAAPAKKEPIQSVQSARQMEQFVSEYKAVVVMFTSPTCGPCQMIKPQFKQLIEEKSENSTSIKVLGVLLDLSVVRDAQDYSIRGVPTFYCYLNGQKYSEFSGANYAELKSQVDVLLFEAYPPHPHRKILLKEIPYQLSVPILYTNVGKLDVVYNKLNEFAGPNLSENDKYILKQSRLLIEEKKAFEISHWHTLMDKILSKLGYDQIFPFLDIFRLLLTHKEVSHFYTKNPTQLGSVFELVEKTPGRATWLMVLRIACNIFSDSTLSTTHFTSHLNASYRTQLTKLLVSSLLSEDAQIRQGAASLAYNCSNNISIERLKKEEGTSVGMAEQEDDDWLVELASAVADALNKEQDEEIVHRLLAAISKLLFLSPAESSVSNLLSALDIHQTIETKKKQGEIKGKVALLGSDICKLV